MTEHAALLRAGRLDDALRLIQAEVRDNPQRFETRLLLFGLECVLGRWEKALAQLETIATLDPQWAMPAFQFRGLIECEARRAEAFQGQSKPIILGEPSEWVGWFVEAFAMAQRGEAAAAWDLRSKAFEKSPAYQCQVNGQDVDWLADADARIGPILEAFVEGRYYWIPFGQIRKVEVNVPETLAELVWAGTKIKLVSGSVIQGFLPVRYPRTE